MRHVLLLLPVLVMPAMACAQAGDELSSRARAAFQAGRYSQAARLFERALTDTSETEGLLYNLAVAWFRAGRLDKAERRFRQLLSVSDSPALIHYNLGLVALEGERKVAARAHFSEALATDRDGRIASLAAEQLDRLGETASNSEPDQGRAFVRAVGGYEHNLNLAGDRRAEAASPFQEAVAWGQRTLRRWHGGRVSVSGLVDYRHYSGHEGADEGVAEPGVALSYPLAPMVTAGVEAEFEWQWLDGERVYRRTESSLFLDWWPGKGLVQFEAGRAGVNAGAAFPELDGSDQFASVDYRRPLTDTVTASAGYSWTEENRDGLVLKDDFYSASPVRHRFEGALAFRPVAQWRLSAGMTYRLSRYQEAEMRAGTRVERRQEERWRLHLGADWQVHPEWHLTLGAEWETNHARLEYRDYRRMEARVGIQRAFRW
ncbi:tetratricopeptide repeat protein [Halomonadaceae bacterium KBTZ08]